MVVAFLRTTSGGAGNFSRDGLLKHTVTLLPIDNGEGD